MATQQITLQEIPELAASLKTAVSAVILGADSTVHSLILAALCGGHVLLEDLPGTGKTTLVKAFAKAAGCGFCRIQCTPDLLPADITGYEMLVQQPDGSHQMQFRKGPVFTNLLLADEINRMAPRSQSGLLECMAERQVTAGGSSYTLPSPFLVFATQNPIELQGTFPLPEAQLDRFFMRLEMGQPARAQELSVLNDRQTGDPLDSVTAVTAPETLCAAQEAVRTVSASCRRNQTASAAPLRTEHPRRTRTASRGTGKCRCFRQRLPAAGRYQGSFSGSLHTPSASVGRSAGGPQNRFRADHRSAGIR